jgi:CDP-diacylglycerol--serine O-phosphatidyltransferase
MLPLYLEGLGLPRTWMPTPVLGAYAVMVAALMAGRVRTFSGKLIGKRVGPEYIAPVIALGVFVVATLVTYPYLSGTVGCLAYFAMIPLSVRRHAELSQQFKVVDAPALAHERQTDPSSDEERLQARR